MISNLLFIWEHQINHDAHFLHSDENRIYVVVATEECDIFEFSLLHLVINNQLRPENIKTQPQLYQSTGHLALTNLIFLFEYVFLRYLRRVAASDEVVFNYEVDDADVLSHPNILVITKSKIARFFGVDCFDNHIGRSGQGGIFVTHELSRECLQLLKGQEVRLQEDVNWIRKVI